MYTPGRRSSEIPPFLDPKDPYKQRYTGLEPLSLKPENRLFLRVGQDTPSNFSSQWKTQFWENPVDAAQPTGVYQVSKVMCKTSDFSKTIYNKNLLDLLNQSSTQKFVLNKPITIEDSISDNKVSLYGSYQEIGNKLYWGRPDSDETKRPLYPNDYIFFR